MYKFGPVQKKILLALMGGVALGLSGSPRQYFKTFRALLREWQKISQQSLIRSVNKLADEKLLEEKILSDRSIKLVLTAEGKKQARRLSLLGNSIKFKKPKQWDEKWRRIFKFPVPLKVFSMLRQMIYPPIRVFPVNYKVA